MKTFTFNGAPVGAVAILLALFSSMGGFIFGTSDRDAGRGGALTLDAGYDTGQISDFLIMPARPRCSSWLADKLGRRRAITIDSIVVSIGTVIQVTAMHSWEQLMVGRIVTGLGIGALSAVVPLYQSETAPKEIRGSLVATYQLFITLGILIAYIISLGTRSLGGAVASGSWRIVLALNILWALVLGVGIFFAPESPRWLMANGKEVEAEAALARIRGVPVEANDLSVKQSWVEIEAAVREEEKMAKLGWFECFLPERKTLYRTLLLMTLQSIQQLTGANFFFYYASGMFRYANIIAYPEHKYQGAVIFSSVGIADPYIVQIILGTVNFFCTFFGIYVLERFGRRTPLIIGGIWQSFWLFVFATAGTIKDPAGDKTVGTLMIVSACLFIAGYASTWAPAIWILVGETFPTRSRAKQGALATSSNWLWNFLIGFFTSFIIADIGYSYGFIFAGCNLAGAIIVFLFLYESSKLSLEAVDDMYNDPSMRAWNSAKWVPAGHESRADFNLAIEAERKENHLKDVQHRELADDEGSQNTVGEEAVGVEKKAFKA
ncbi:hypothetical protein RQP46_009326 [Phenoliferia psychrophenolica]